MKSSQPHLEHVTIVIRIDLDTVRRSKAVLKALIPDNVRFPKGLSLDMFAKGSALLVKVQGKNIAMKTIVSTIDEILEHVTMCQKVMAK